VAQDGQLEAVDVREGRAELGVGVGTVERRIEVRSAGDAQAVQPGSGSIMSTATGARTTGMPPACSTASA
jgi:hypothetical protein